MSINDDFKKSEGKAYRFVLILFSTMIVFISASIAYSIIKPNLFGFQPELSSITKNPSKANFKDGIHLRTGLINAKGLMTVINNCTGCHSSKIILQNRMNADRWNATIKWMQETQNLWDLGKNQEIIVNYLVSNYPVEDKGRRENLSDIEWYELEN